MRMIAPGSRWTRARGAALVATLTVTIPADITPGTHRLITSINGEAIDTQTFTVAAMPATGADLLGNATLAALLALVGIAAVLAARRTCNTQTITD